MTEPSLLREGCSVYASTTPNTKDTPSIRWKKINQHYSEANGSVHPPTNKDWKYQSIWKVLAILTGS